MSTILCSSAGTTRVELLWRYLIKHPVGVDLESLDFEAVDKEMVADEATQTAQATVIAPEGNAPEPTEVDDGEVGV